MGYDVSAAGIKFVLDEIGITDISDRQLITYKLIVYLTKSIETILEQEQPKHG